MLRCESKDGPQLRRLHERRIKFTRLEVDIFLLLVTHFAQANFPLLELAVHHLVLGAGGGAQDLDSGYWADEFKGPMLLEALVLLVVNFRPLLAISTPHGVVEVPTRV